MTQHAFYFDNSRCTGCRTCEMACKDYRDLACDIRYRKVYDYEGGTTALAEDGTVVSSCFVYHLSVSCNHCDDPACAKVCPTGAMHKDAETGLVSVDEGKCIGCGYCHMACPYNSPVVDREVGHSVKCDGAASALGAPQAASRSFHHLFVGPGHLEAPPWGSVYTDHEKVRFGESCLELGLWMRRRGIERLAAQTEPADHFGCMLSLLGWLAEHRPELVGEYLSEHLLTWAQHYLERLRPVAQREGQPLYCGAAELASELLAAVQERMGLQVAYPRYFM